MAKEKRYYWMKLKESFMTSDTIDYFMSQPDGANYVVLYQMLCLKTINTDGRLSRTLGEVIIPYDIEKIRRDMKWFSADTIRVALNLYKAVGLIYEDVDGTLVLTNHSDMVGSESNWAAQKKRQREMSSPGDLKQIEGGGQCPQNVHLNVHPEIEIDIRDRDRDRELDIDTNVKKESIEKEKRFAPPSPQEVDSYIKGLGLSIDAERFCDFYESKGWMVGKAKMKDWRAAARNWARRDRPSELGRAAEGTEGQGSKWHVKYDNIPG